MLFLNLAVMVALQVLPLQSYFLRSPFSSKTKTKSMFEGTKSMFGSNKPFSIKFPNFWGLLFPASGSKNLDGTMGQDRLIPFLFLRPPPPQYHVPDENVITFEDNNGLKLSTEEELALYQPIGENIQNDRNPHANVILDQHSPPRPIDINNEAGFSSHHKVFHYDADFPAQDMLNDAVETNQNMLNDAIKTNQQIATQQIANLDDQNSLNELSINIPSGVYFRPNRAHQGVDSLTDLSHNVELSVSNNIDNNIQAMLLNDDEMNSVGLSSANDRPTIIVGLSSGRDKNDARLRPITFPDHQHNIIAPTFENESDNIEKQTFNYQSGFQPMNKPSMESKLMIKPKPDGKTNEWTGINRPKQHVYNLVPQRKPIRNKFEGSSGKQVGFSSYVVQMPSMHAASMFAYPIHESSVSRRGVRGTYRNSRRGVKGTYPNSRRGVKGTYLNSRRGVRGTYPNSRRGVKGTYLNSRRGVKGTYTNSRRGMRGTYTNSIDRTDKTLSDFTYIPIKKVIPGYIHLKAYRIEY